MKASSRIREWRRNNARRSTATAAVTSVLAAATVVVLGSGGSIGGLGVGAFATLSPSPSYAHTTATSPTMTTRRRSFAMVPRGYIDKSSGGTRMLTTTTPPSSSPSSLPRLSQQQEITLLRRMRNHPPHSEESQSARQLLLLHNLPLVRSIVTKLLRSRGLGVGEMEGAALQNQLHQNQMSLSREDLLHEGTIGLAEAIDRYDLSYAPPEEEGEEEEEGGFVGGGVARLGTYATYWIRARVLRAMQRGEHSLLRFPEHAVQASHRLVKAAREMGLAWDDVAMLAEGRSNVNNVHDTDGDADVAVVLDGQIMSDVIIQTKLREKLRTAAGIATDGLFRDAVRVRSMSRAGSTKLESWMFYPPTTSSDLVSSATDGIAMDDDLLGQEHIVETLSKFLIPREVEVLSLRYGLVSQPAVRNGAIFRDFEAEAEEELFGPGGMLSHYSAMPLKSDVSGDRSSPRQMVPTAATVETLSSTRFGLPTSTSPSLLPFREIGRRMEFSAEYCRRTCSAALVKLARAAEEGRLAESDFLLGW